MVMSWTKESLIRSIYQIVMLSYYYLQGSYLQIQNSSFFAQEKGRCYYYPYCFAQFLAYIERLKAPDPDNQSALVINSNVGTREQEPDRT
jgi:hypothetical protein